MKRNFSLRTYLGLSHALLLTLSLGTIGFIWSRSDYQVIARELNRVMKDRATSLANILRHELEEHNELYREEGDFPIINQEKNLSAVFIDSKGNLFELVPGTVSSEQREEFLSFYDEYPLSRYSYSRLVSSESGNTYVYAAAPVIDPRNILLGEVCLLMPMSDLDAYVIRMRWLLVGAIGVVAAIGVGASALLTRYFSRQFSQVQRLAATVSEGNYHLRIPEDGPTELRNLSHYMNVMAERLQQQGKMRQELLANVTHELARPLAGLQLGIESLRNGAFKKPELADDLLVGMGQTVERLSDLIDDIALAASPLARQIELQRTILEVEPLLRNVAARFQSQALARRISLHICKCVSLPPVYADEKRLHQILGNLLDNAIKFTPHGKEIQIWAEAGDAGQVRLLIHDGGKGIAPADAGRIFEAFYQGDMGLRVKQGMGLGLTIAKRLALAHGGSLTLENHPQGGALAVLTLPAAMSLNFQTDRTSKRTPA